MPKWISVKDKLPKTNNNYLCVLNNCAISIGTLLGGVLMAIICAGDEK